MAIPKNIWRWAFYDFANSGYLLIYPTVLLPVLFAMIFKDTGYSLGMWGIANAVATLLGVLISILIGKYSDKHSKFQAFKWAIVISFIGMMSIALAVEYFIGALFYLYVFTHAVFILTLSLSDSILPYVVAATAGSSTAKKDAYEYSGFAWGFGYLGGVAALIIAIVLQKILADDYHPLVFASTAVFYIIFSIYSLRGLKEVKMNEEAPAKPTVFMTKLQRFFLLLGYWFISEGITVVILFISIYLSMELEFSSAKIGIVFLLVQLLAFPATWFGGKLANKFNTLNLLGVTIFFFGVAIFFMVMNLGMIGLAFIIVSGALALGNSQSYLRAQYSNVIERSESGFQFGIYTIVSEASVFIGPIAYGFASDYFHSQKIPLIILFGTMVVGYILIWRVERRII
ncbi:MAG: MFS transporter [Patescibacteria group bacterium]